MLAETLRQKLSEIMMSTTTLSNNEENVFVTGAICNQRRERKKSGNNQSLERQVQECLVGMEPKTARLEGSRKYKRDKLKESSGWDDSISPKSRNGESRSRLST